MDESKRFGLLAAYKTPRFKYGQIVVCEMRGEVEIVGLNDGKIPWPIGKKGRAKGLILYRDLVRAVRRESNQAVAYWWGVSGQTVTKWRHALQVESTLGSSRLRSAYSELASNIRRLPNSNEKKLPIMPKQSWQVLLP